MTEPPDDLEGWVTSAQQGDENAFRAIYRDTQPRLLRYLYALVGDDAEDVAADAWLQISRDLAAFTGDGPGFRAWAATIARNRAMDHLRKMRRRPATAVPVENLAEIASGDDTAGAVLGGLATSEAMALIASLPRDQAEAVLLRVIVGMDAESAAQVLGKRSGAVRTASYRGLRSLARKLQKTPGARVTHGTAPALRGTR